MENADRSVFKLPALGFCEELGAVGGGGGEGSFVLGQTSRATFVGRRYGMAIFLDSPLCQVKWCSSPSHFSSFFAV